MCKLAYVFFNKNYILLYQHSLAVCRLIGCFWIGAFLVGWSRPKYIWKQRSTSTILWLTSRVEKARLSCLPVCVCLSSQYEFHSLLLLPLSEECTPRSIQYYDSLSFNCFLRGPCSPYLGKLVALPLMYHDVLSFLLELFEKAFFFCLSCNFNGTQCNDKCGQKQVFNVGLSLRERMFLIVSSLFLIIDHYDIVSRKNLNCIYKTAHFSQWWTKHVPNWLTR